MANYLLCSSPIHGHVSPMAAIAEHLVDIGHRVTMLTGSRFAGALEACGVTPRPLSGRADFDDRDPASYLPERSQHRGLQQAQYDIQTIFVRTIPDQFRSVCAALRASRYDAVLVDSAFAGVLPLLLDRTTARPPILMAGVLGLSQSSSDVAPFGMGLQPSTAPWGRLRNRALTLVAHKVLFRATQQLAQQMLAEVGSPPLDRFAMDLTSLPDRFLQLCVPEFEYSRHDLSPNVRFVGPVVPAPSGAEVPAWWGDLDGDRPVVHVTQGTIDNADLGRLVRPTVQGLADDPVLVVVSTGGRPVAELGPVPANVRVAEYLPYDRLLPRTSVMVTNAGYGGVQHALSCGVPLVAAGDTEDKPEVAARIRYADVGLDLRTGTPSAAVVADAVRKVLSDRSIRAAARGMAEIIAGYDARSAIAEELAAAGHEAPHAP